MPNTTRRDTHCDFSEESELSSSEIALGARGVTSEDDRDSPESDDHGEHIAPAIPDTQVLRQLSVLERQMVHNFRSLHDDLRDTNRRLDDTNKQLNEHRADTNRRFDEQQADTKRRFDEQQADMKRRFDEQQADTKRRFDEQRADTKRRFDEHGNNLSQLKAQLHQLKAQQVNKGATYINNLIQPVGRDDGTPIPTALSNRYKYVHEFLRLKRPTKWPVLATLLRFYRSDSWSTWGLISLSPGDDSDAEEPLVAHESLEIAISWAPEIALQDLARYLGLDYDRIMINVEEYERLRQSRADHTKRTIVDEPGLPKRERLETAEQQGYITQVNRERKPASINTMSGELGWDTRATEDRTPESKRLRFRDAGQYRQSTLSPTSVATSDAQLPTRTKP